MGSIRWGVGLLSVALAFGAVIPAQAAGHPGQPSDPAGLDVLFVGAHPDDESGILSTLGQLHIDHRLRVGVVTVTRGEGGGNAVGTEEGPALGLVREAEERRALAEVGVVEVINLDKADFYYTVSAPLTDQVWGHDDTLDRLVRVVRRTRPKIVLTMDPAPSPGNHGNHQESARLAVEAYQAAADPAAFAEQISREGLRPWAVSRLFTDDMRGHAATGPNCVADFAPTEPTDLVWGVWAGARAPDGRSWAQVERSAQREYASQGWAGFPDVPTDPNAIGCDYLTQVASRVPYRTDHRGIDGVLDGTDGAGLVAEAGDYTVTPGSSTHVAVRVSAASAAARAKLSVPPEWQVSGGGELTPGDPSTAEFTVTVPRGATPGKVRLPVTVSSPGRAEETTTALLEVTAPVVAEQQPLPQVAQFREWARGVGHPELADLVPPVLTL
ncbi:MAG: PIG-L family deacetylase, partial [Kutzneria sp.]|nr:PIG-L family deacetylase [Kutzneria sp.]